MKERPSRLAGRKKHKNRSMKERNSEKEIGELQCRRRDLTTEIRRRRTSVCGERGQQTLLDFS
jgi:hypothetical protein